MTVSPPVAPLRMALAEFLDWPGDGRAKHHQLVDGEVRAMAPASAVHGTIQATLAPFSSAALCTKLGALAGSL